MQEFIIKNKNKSISKSICYNLSMKNEYKQLNPVTNKDDIGVAINLLIQDNIKKVNTSFIAEIVSINGNKVSIKKKIKDKANDKDTIYNNCMIGFSQSGFWQEQFKLKVGDDGIAFVMQDDVSNYKSTGKGGINPSGRIQDKNDSVFIPLSLFETLQNNDINYLLKSLDGICKLEFNNDNICTLQAKEIVINTQNNLAKVDFKEDGLIEFTSTLLSLKSENTTLKTKLKELSTILRNALIDQTPSGTQPFNSATITAFANWDTSLNDLFKD